MTARLVIIPSCGANLASLTFALERLGVTASVTEDSEQIRAASHVLLPGVGAAPDAMERLTAAGLTDVIPRLQQPVLGICMGQQLLFSASDEAQTTCLGIIEGRAHRFRQPGLPVPQMGWNQIHRRGDSRLLDGIDDGEYAYFIHSYAVPEGPYTVAAADYGGPFSAVVEQGNFYGTQFHPERSADVGARLLANFMKL